MSDLSKLSRNELILMIRQLEEKNCLLETELNYYKNESKEYKSKKRQKSSGSEALDRQTVNKKSFSDRICDDLCEEILQYLSLEDKLKLEGVSKQFQRTVLKKHFELTIETYYWIPKRIVEKVYKYFIENIFIELKSLEVLLKKCPNITSIELKTPSFGECDYNEVFRLITKYCNNLREIDFDGNQITDENIEEFQQKFGPKINSFYRLKDANNYNLFPNIEKLKFEFLRDSHLLEAIPRLKLNKLSKLELNLKNGEQYMIKTSVDTFPSLKYFLVDIRFKNQHQINELLEFISKLKHLIDFSFKSYDENNKLFCDSLKRMANKCQKLKSFECSLCMTENSDLIQMLSSIKAFPALKRLNLNLKEYFRKKVVKDSFSFEAFKGLSNITHLTLNFNFVKFKEMTFKDIDINLPNLQYLLIYIEFDSNREEVTEMADILSRLSKLKTLKLRISSYLNNNEIEVIFREKCKKLQTFKIISHL